MQLGKSFWCQPVFNAHNFYWVHVCHPLFKDYPQVIHGRCMERALLGFKVEVVVKHNLEYCNTMTGIIVRRALWFWSFVE